MATIPMGNFGNSLARPGPVQGVQRLDALNAAADRTGQIAGGIVTDMAAQETQRKQAAQRAQAALTLATLGNDLHDAHDQVAKGVLDGSIAPDKASATFNEAATKLQGERLSGYMPEQRDTMTTHAVGITGSLQRSLGGVVLKRQQTDTAATIDQFGEQVSREATRQGPDWASQKFGAMVDFTGSAAGWTDAQKEAKKQAFKERATWSFYDAAGTGALTRGDAEGLGELVKQVQGPQGEAMDPIRRSQITHQLFGYQQNILAKRAKAANDLENEQRLRDNAAGEIWNKGMELFQAGKAFDAGFIKDMTTTGVGTKYEQDIAGLLAAQAAGTGFATKSAPQRDALLTDLEAQEATQGIGTNPAQTAAIKALREMNNKLKTAAESNPWQAGAAAGKIPAMPPINATNPGDAAAAVEERMKVIGQLEQWVGHKVSPIQPQEADQISKALRSVTPDQSAMVLSQFGQSLQDGERIAQVAKQLGATSEVHELMMLSAGDKTNAGRYNAELIARGAQALADKTVKKDDAALTGWKAEIASLVNGTLGNPNDETKIKQAAYYIRAAMEDGTAKATGFDRGFGSSAQEAIALVAGGPIERQGQRTLLPRGMKEAEFDDALSKFTPDRLKTESFTGKFYAGGREVSAEVLARELGGAGMRRWSADTFVPMVNGRMITTDPSGVIPLKLKVLQ